MNREQTIYNFLVPMTTGMDSLMRVELVSELLGRLDANARPLWSAAHVAKYIGRPVSTLQRWYSETPGRIRLPVAMRTPLGPLFDPEEIKDWAKAHQAEVPRGARVWVDIMGLR